MLKIRLAKTSEEREQVFRLRHRVYVEEMEYKQHYADHKNQRIEEPLDKSSILLAAFCGEQVVGTVRVNLARSSDLKYYSQLYQMHTVGEVHPSHTSITTKLIVQQNFRKSRLCLYLMLAIYQQFLLNQIKFDFIDCDPKMVPLFRKLGYKNINICDHSEYGRSMVMILDVLNLKHLEEINSPFVAILKSFLEQSN